MNTGGNVGSAAWVFADQILKLPLIAMTGVDLGYYRDTPLQQTQGYYELLDRIGPQEDIEKYFVESVFPLSGEKFYTDVTYAWYRNGFLDLYKKGSGKTYNCTEAGTLVHPSLPCISLDEFFKITSRG